MTTITAFSAAHAPPKRINRVVELIANVATTLGFQSFKKISIDIATPVGAALRQHDVRATTIVTNTLVNSGLTCAYGRTPADNASRVLSSEAILCDDITGLTCAGSRQPAFKASGLLKAARALVNSGLTCAGSRQVARTRNMGFAAI